MTLSALVEALEQSPLSGFPSRRAAELAVALCREFRTPTPDGLGAFDGVPLPAVAKAEAAKPKPRKARGAYRKKGKVTA